MKDERDFFGPFRFQNKYAQSLHLPQFIYSAIYGPDYTKGFNFLADELYERSRKFIPICTDCLCNLHTVF